MLRKQCRWKGTVEYLKNHLPFEEWGV